MRPISSQSYFTITCILLGLLISANIHSYVESKAQSEVDQESQLDFAMELRKKEEDLIHEIIKTKEIVDHMEWEIEYGYNPYHTLMQEYERFQLINGEVPVKGIGIEVQINTEDGVWYNELTSLINELWAAGAEAVAINGQRVAFDSQFYRDVHENEWKIMYNNEPLQFPLIIEAIGNPAVLEKGLTLPGGFVDQVSIFGMKPTINQVEKIKMPAIERIEYED